MSTNGIGPTAPEGGELVSEDAGLDVLHLALRDLRRQIQSRVESPAASALDATQTDWMELFGQIRQRASAFGVAERSAEVDEFGFDPQALTQARGLLDLMMDRYWRVECQGLEQLDPDRPSLLVANRSGLLPYDGLILSHAIERMHPRGLRPRFLVADWLVTLPFMQPALARLGGVRACRENADRLLRSGHSVIAFPEGAKGAAKVFTDRYQLKRFGRGGVIRAAVENGVPLVPVGIVGAEEAHPILWKAQGPARAMGLPFVPVTPTFPLLGPLGLLPLPTKWILNVGEPIPLDDLGPSALADELLLSRLTEELRGRIQSLVNEALKAREGVWG